jgi:hypothetical protein
VGFGRGEPVERETEAAFSNDEEGKLVKGVRKDIAKCKNRVWPYRTLTLKVSFCTTGISISFLSLHPSAETISRYVLRVCFQTISYLTKSMIEARAVNDELRCSQVIVKGRTHDSTVLSPGLLIRSY